MKACFVIVAVLALGLVCEAANHFAPKFNKQLVRTKLYGFLHADLEVCSEKALKYWNLAKAEKDSALAARYSLAAETITSFSTIRYTPLYDAVIHIIEGVNFKRELAKFLTINADLKTKIDDKLKDLYQLGKDSQDAKIFFDDVKDLAFMLEQSSTNIRAMIDGGEEKFTEN